MKKHLVSVTLFGLLPAAVIAAANSPIGSITNFVPRNNGYHSLFLSVSIPAQGCTLADRGIIVETDIGGKALLATIMLAVTGGNQVDVRVNGCAPVNPDETVETAPKIVKIGVRF